MAVVVHSSLGKKGAGNYHLVLEQDVKGGYRTVATISDRDNIPEWARRPGMKVSVIAESFKEYKLGIDTTINGQQWTAVSKENALTEDDLGVNVPPLGPDKKIDTIYLPNIFLNDVYPVGTIAEMLALNTVTGNAVIVADVGDGTGATYFKKNDVNPATVDDFIIIIFPGAVTSVNGQSGEVTITVAGLLNVSSNLTAFRDAVANSPAISTINSIIANINNSITGINNSIASLQEQIDQIIASQGGAGVGIELYTEKEYVSGKYVEYENNGVTGIYRSVQDVPDTANPTDTEYWKLISGSVAKATQNEQEVGLDDKKYTTSKGNLEALKSWLGTGLKWESADKKIKLDRIQEQIDSKLSIRGDNFIATRPGVNSTTNAEQLISIYEEAALLTPGGNPLSGTNRVSILVFPGVYGTGDSNPKLNLVEYVDIVGFGPIESVIIDMYITQSSNVNDVRLEGFSKSTIQLHSDSSNKSIYRNLSNVTFDAFLSTEVNPLRARFENIFNLQYLMYAIDRTVSATMINIKGGSSVIAETYDNITDANIFDVDLELWVDNVQSSTIEKATLRNNLGNIKVENTVLRNCVIKLDEEDNPSFLIGENVELYNCTINCNLTPSGTTTIKMAYCTSTVGNPWSGTNLISNGHNSWDEEGSGTGLTPEQENKIDNTPENTNQEITDINADILAANQDIQAIENNLITIENEWIEYHYFGLDENGTLISINTLPTVEDMIFDSMEIVPRNPEDEMTATLTNFEVGVTVPKDTYRSIQVNVEGVVKLYGRLI